MTIQTFQKVTAEEAWDLANQFDWETDERFGGLWELITEHEETPNELCTRLLFIMNNEFGVTYDAEGDETIDTYDEMDDLVHQYR